MSCSSGTPLQLQSADSAKLSENAMSYWLGPSSNESQVTKLGIPALGARRCDSPPKKKGLGGGRVWLVAQYACPLVAG